MTAILDELCGELRNYFVRSVHGGTFTIDGGALLPPDGIQHGQYYCISGSVFNDGVHRWPEEMLTDETFDGEIWFMAVPPGFVELASHVAEYRSKWDELTAAGKWSGYQSESFEGYSYSLPSDAPPELREMAARILAGKRRYRKV